MPGGACARCEPCGAGDDEPAFETRMASPAFHRRQHERMSMRQLRLRLMRLRRQAAGAAGGRRGRVGRRSCGAADDLPQPAFTGVRVLEDFSLATLREFIDWSPFFHTWGLKGIYPRISGRRCGPRRAEARELFVPTATALLDRIVEEKLLTARGVYGFFAGRMPWAMMSQLYSDDERVRRSWLRFHFLRQQANREGKEPCRSLADFIAPQRYGAMHDSPGGVCGHGGDRG